MKKKVVCMCTAFIGAECETIVVAYPSAPGLPDQSIAFASRQEFFDWFNEQMEKDNKE